MAESFQVAEVKYLYRGSVYVLDAFRAAEIANSGNRSVLSSSALMAYIRHTSKDASDTLDRTVTPDVQVRKWATEAVKDLVVERVSVGGGHAAGGGGRQTDYALTARGRVLANLPLRSAP